MELKSVGVNVNVRIRCWDKVTLWGMSTVRIGLMGCLLRARSPGPRKSRASGIGTAHR